MKKLSLFDLKEGRIYAAYDDGRLLSRTYRIKNGKLQNDEGSEGGHYIGCTWVPIDEKITFEEVGKFKVKKSASKTTRKAVSVFELQEGIAYYNLMIGTVSRIGSTLVALNKDLTASKVLTFPKLNLAKPFKKVGKMDTSSLIKAGVQDLPR